MFVCLNFVLNFIAFFFFFKLKNNNQDSKVFGINDTPIASPPKSLPTDGGICVPLTEIIYRNAQYYPQYKLLYFVSNKHV